MKKIFIRLSLIASIFLVSCDESLLDSYTPGTLTEENAILSVTDLQRLMNGAYSSLTPIAEITFNSVFTDEVAIGFSNGGQGLADNYVFNLNSDSASPNGIWVANYVTIATSNRVIKAADRLLIDTPGDTNAINRIKAEALTIRAYCHNQLLSYFSTNPKDLNALGVIIANNVYPYDYTSIRSKNQDVYTQIDTDLTNAIALFTSVGGAPNRLAANIDFARATKARSFALRGDYPNALIAANDVIASSGLVLATYANYRQMFHTDVHPATTEIIFKLKKNPGQTRTGAIWASVAPTAAGSPFYEMSRSFYNLFPTTTADIRYTTCVNNTGTNLDIDPAYASIVNYGPNSEKIIIRKHPGTGTASNRVFVNDMKISRLSEMYLIRAEAYAAAGDLTNSALDVQAIRNARFSSAQVLPVFATPQDAWKAILEERRKEFAYEGYRFVDLKRLGALAGVSINRDSQDCSNYGSCSIAITDYRFTLPIPTAETNANDAILSQQNPGY
jgi:hypothetical protein